MIETMGDQPLLAGNGTSKSNTLGRRKSRPAPQPPTRNNTCHPLERLMDELDIRHPSELVIGVTKTVATQWRHKPQNLLRPGVCYEAQVCFFFNSIPRFNRFLK